MSIVSKNWQTTRATIRERSKFMFDNDLFTDVKFLVTKANGESESKQVISAHKLVLSISSPVFEAMFYGELAETGDSIELPDCEYDSLLELFRYMYSDEVNLSGSNVMAVLYLAKKYIVPSLADKCTKYLEDNLDPSNVFSILPSARKYEEKNLVDQCWKVIDKQTEEAVKSDGFATIERSLLEAVVVRDTLTIEEIQLFKAVDLWATKQCEKQGLAADGATKRRILGEDVIKGIRFPTMKQEDFATVVLDCEILRKKEIVSVIKHLSSASTIKVGFPETKRPGFVRDIQRCCRFGSLSSDVYRYHEKRKDAISFSVDKDTELRGVCLFGSENNTYRVDLNIDNTDGKRPLVSKTGNFASKLIQCEKYSYHGFEVMFDEKVILSKNIMYWLCAKISGPDSLCGGDGVSSINCGDVTITFSKSYYRFVGYVNESTVQVGQFPEFLVA